MSIRKQAGWTVAILGALGALAVAGCSDNKATPQDAQVRDVQVNKDGPPDGALDAAGDARRGDGLATDGSGEGTLKDLQPDVGLGPCKKAHPLVLSDGYGVAKGELVRGKSVNDHDLPKDGCMKKATPGPDDEYNVELDAGTEYRIVLEPSKDLNAALYLLGDCAATATSCLLGVDEFLSAGTEIIDYTPSKTGPVTIVVDSTNPTTSAFAYGRYTLIVSKKRPPANNACEDAEKLDLSKGRAVALGDTYNATNTLELSSSSCTKSMTSGPDRFYKVTLTANTTYKVRLAPATSFDTAVYLLASCTDAKTSCVGGADDGFVGGVESFLYQPKTTGDFIVVVDSKYPRSLRSGQGSYKLEVYPFVAPKNDTCATATALALQAGKATVQGDTTDATNTIALPKTGCTGRATDGGELFYSLAAQAGTTYRISVTPSSDFDAALFVAGDCTNLAQACEAGADLPGVGKAEKLVFTAKKTGTYLVVVDSAFPPSAKEGQGTFALTVEALATPANSSCSAAAALTFVGNQATVSGDTTVATNDVTLPATGCVGKETVGADVFYQLPVTAGQTYRISAMSKTFLFDPALYLISDCSGSQGSCVAGADDALMDEPEVLIYTATAAATYRIGVDSAFATSKGEFDLTVDKITLPTNNACKDATLLTMTPSGVSVSSTTESASNTLSMLGASCLPGPTRGPDVFYKVLLAAGKTYAIALTGKGAYDPALYVFTDCAAASATCKAGKDVPAVGGTETVTITPQTDTTYMIGVDSYGYASRGSFTLTIN